MIFDSIFSGLAPVIYKSKTPLRAMEGPLIFTSALYLLFWSPFVSIKIHFFMILKAYYSINVHTLRIVDNMMKRGRVIFTPLPLLCPGLLIR